MESKNKKFDVVALGELLIDMTSHGVTEQGNVLFEANPGGAPCNVLAMLKKLDREVSFIGKIGQDVLGYKLKNKIENVGIDTQNLIIDKDIRTTVAFVETFEDGDRDFSFFRNPGADMMLKKNEINSDLLSEAEIFHFGTLSMTHDDVREATKYAVVEAKKNGAIISFDPNIREPLWDDLEVAKEQVLWALGQCDVLKISDNEITWLTGESDYSAGVKWIRDRYDIPMILVSMGKEGSRAYFKNRENGMEYMVEAKPFLNRNTVETTGAGDVFCACVLHRILKSGLTDYTTKDLEDMLRFANAAASVITTRHGALSVMPSLEEIEAVLG